MTRTRYDFLEAWQVTLSNVWTVSYFTYFYFSFEFYLIMGRYDFLEFERVILINVWAESNFT